jgi:hypothetical protein
MLVGDGRDNRVPAEIRALAAAANMVTISRRRELRWARAPRFAY